MAVISTPTSAKPTLAPPLASPFRSSRSVPSKYLTSRPSRKLPVDQPKIVSKPPPAAVALPQDWLDLAWLPERQEETKLDEVVKGVIFQAIAGAWIALLGLGDERAFVSLTALCSYRLTFCARSLQFCGILSLTLLLDHLACIPSRLPYFCLDRRPHPSSTFSTVLFGAQTSLTQQLTGFNSASQL